MSTAKALAYKPMRTYIPEWLLFVLGADVQEARIKAVDVSVLLFIANRSGLNSLGQLSRNNACMQSRKALSGLLGWKRTSISGSWRRLRELGYITSLRNGDNSLRTWICGANILARYEELKAKELITTVDPKGTEIVGGLLRPAKVAELAAQHNVNTEAIKDAWLAKDALKHSPTKWVEGTGIKDMRLAHVCGWLDADQYARAEELHKIYSAEEADSEFAFDEPQAWVPSEEHDDVD